MSVRCSSPSTRIHAKTRAERQDPGRQAERGGPRAPASARFHDGKSTGSASALGCRPAAVDQRAQVRRASARAGERAFVDARLEAILERHHQLDALERAQPELLERRRSARDRRAPAYFAISAFSRSCRPHARRGVAPLRTQSRIAARFSFRVPSVRGSSGSGQTMRLRIR